MFAVCTMITNFFVGKQSHNFEQIFKCFWSGCAHILVGTHLRHFL